MAPGRHKRPVRGQQAIAAAEHHDPQGILKAHFIEMKRSIERCRRTPRSAGDTESHEYTYQYADDLTRQNPTIRRGY